MAHDATESRAAADIVQSMSIRGIRRIAVDRLLRAVWNGLVALGMLYVTGETAPADPVMGLPEASAGL
ncbi:hypothetical protein AC230_16915 [Streptomyces caatingaensis]|uniref:Uncharacterized protein n=1 Tax=Streptomyces caatingaensis TaxID=1678637 RepID=A0A0K9XD07_9ACTN|nr:hypothetical protein AC230_16915 [Streptomyces caatingaensis]